MTKSPNLCETLFIHAAYCFGRKQERLHARGVQARVSDSKEGMEMELTRRNFLKGALAGGAMAGASAALAS